VLMWWGIWVEMLGEGIKDGGLMDRWLWEESLRDERLQGEKRWAGCWGQPRPGGERTGWASPPSPCGRPCRTGRPTKEAGVRLPAVDLSVGP